MISKAISNLNFNKFSSRSSLLNEVYVLSAIRTPICLLNGSFININVLELGSLVLKESLIRAMVPAKDIQNIFVGCALEDFSQQELKKQFLYSAGLSKSTKIDSTSTSGMQSTVNASKVLQIEKGVSVAIGMESMSNASTSKSQEFMNLLLQTFDLPIELNKKEMNNNNNLLLDSQNHFLQSLSNLTSGYKAGVFQDEITETVFKKKGQHVIATKDEIIETYKNDSIKQNSNYKRFAEAGDGAAAIVIATNDYVEKNNLSPLAKIISIAEQEANPQNVISALVTSINKALKVADLNIENIDLWEIDDIFGSISLECIRHLNINPKLINQNGNSLCLGYPVGMSGSRILCHLSHTLLDDNIGCGAAFSTNNKANAIVIKKMKSLTPNKPHLKLFTKYPCQLCEELKENLKPFQGRFSISEIDIEAKENEKFKKLYCYDIPVLFLDGLFVCKHKLNVEYFNKRLIKCEKAR